MATFSVRRSGFSLKIQAIRPLAVFGTRRRLLYAERASCGYRICEFLTNSER